MKTKSLLVAGALALSLGAQAASQAAALTTSTTTTQTAVNLTYPERGQGRGGWPNSGKGGTLSLDGTKPGRFYRAPAVAGTKGIGYVGYTAVRTGAPASVNDYAVYRAVLAVQTQLRERGYTDAAGRQIVADGIWGARTDEAVKKFQQAHGLTADGIFGPASARAMFAPLVQRVAGTVDPLHKAEVARIMTGTVNWESGWDPGAVGGLTPADLGLGQINGPAHPSMSVDARLDPKQSLPYVAQIIKGNLIAFNYRLDEAVAAYNLGQGGARSWVRAGKPQYWPAGSTNDIHRYITKILTPVG